MEEHYLYTAEQVRALDRVAIESFNVDSFELMQQAGRAAFQAIEQCYPAKNHLLIFCGKGNNGGDGYIVARWAKDAGWQVSVQALSTIDKLSGDAQRAALLAEEAGVNIASLNCVTDVCTQHTVIVDALLGTGFKGKLQADYQRAIRFINQLDAPCISIDVPSGLNATTGVCTQEAVAANQTVTFIGNKRGLYTADGPDYAGKIIYCSLHLDSRIYQREQALCQLLKRSDHALTPRRKNSHKGDYGHVVVVGGGPGMLGAGLMAATAALRSGAGLVTLVTAQEHVASVALYQPELMSYGLSERGINAGLTDLIESADVILIGPGLDMACWSVAVMDSAIRQAVSLNKKLLLDAGALAWLAKNPIQYKNWILTPHPGEAAALLACNSQDIQQDRFIALKQLQQKYQGTVVLKGCGSLIATAKRLYVCPYGNPGMASAGMGDVLAGMSAGIFAQCLEADRSACIAVAQHAWTADRLRGQKGEACLLASDIVHDLRL